MKIKKSLKPAEWLKKNVIVKIDRPLGSSHPNYPKTIYPVNYGYIPGTLSKADSKEVDAYVFGPKKALDVFKGKVIAVVLRIR